MDMWVAAAKCIDFLIVILLLLVNAQLLEISLFIYFFFAQHTYPRQVALVFRYDLNTNPHPAD